MSDKYTYKNYGVTLSNISEGLYSIEEIEKLLVDMKATKKQTEERLNMIMQAELPDDDDDTQVYKKPWAGLTDEDIEATWSQLWKNINQMKVASEDRPTQETVRRLFARALETKLKGKNT